MDNQENFPIKQAANSAIANIEGGGSLVGRGLAALRKDNDALYRQARVVFDRIEVNRWNAADNPDIYSAFKIFQQLADQNYGKAYFPLSILYGDKRDIEVGRDRAQHFAQLAFDWCFANQANQDVEVWFDLGAMYISSRGVKEDREQAVYWWRKAAEQGYAVAQFWLGKMYSRRESGVPQDDKLAVYWMSKAAEQGHKRGQFELGCMYSGHNIGCNIEKNDEQAVYWFRKAAEQGDENAQYNLGLRYEEGRGVCQDDEQAVYWYRKAAEQCHERGQWKLGCMYSKGRVVEKNDEQAVHWFRKSAEQGDANAQYNLGVMYEEGRGVEQNYQVAVKWYQLAADQNQTDAQIAISKVQLRFDLEK